MWWTDLLWGFWNGITAWRPNTLDQRLGPQTYGKSGGKNHLRLTDLLFLASI